MNHPARVIRLFILHPSEFILLHVGWKALESFSPGLQPGARVHFVLGVSATSPY